MKWIYLIPLVLLPFPVSGLADSVLECPAVQRPVTLSRGPYIQMLTPTSVILRWRTDEPVTGAVLSYRDDGSERSIQSGPVTTEHTAELTGLEPARTYRYEICGLRRDARRQARMHFRTAPPAGSEADTRIWVIGDSGTANREARQVFEQYKALTGTAHTDVWLMLGDNAYPAGTDKQYQAAVFDMYSALLPNTALWAVLGNHDARSSDHAAGTGPFFEIFDLPTAGEAGGVASGTESYNAFDYSNIHFVALDTEGLDEGLDNEMLQWLEADLAANSQTWTIAYMHHPPYSSGTHESDTSEPLIPVRENIVPLLEHHDVDLVLAAHSHGYERSYLMTGHYGESSTFDAARHVLDDSDGDPRRGGYRKNWERTPYGGTVYAVVGSSGQIEHASLDHPALPVAAQALGSMVIEVSGNHLDARAIGATGQIIDRFRIVKE
ncbi:MAG: metallophosphoesterase family protein [Candidatus Competibacterales bacterium]|nr:metallophosphoesterase family protein [Candidatus Competibacterales bacterium]